MEIWPGTAQSPLLKHSGAESGWAVEENLRPVRAVFC
jgi:hypothetical protein